MIKHIFIFLAICTAFFSLASAHPEDYPLHHMGGMLWMGAFWEIVMLLTVVLLVLLIIWVIKQIQER